MTRRKGGWRKDHPDAVVVARPTKWGNPFTIASAKEAGYDRATAVSAFRDWLAGDPWACGCREDYEDRRQTMIANLEELRGKDLACWCPLEVACHADVLLEVANRPIRSLDPE